jgi:hypothetical protein
MNRVNACAVIAVAAIIATGLVDAIPMEERYRTGRDLHFHGTPYIVVDTWDADLHLGDQHEHDAVIIPPQYRMAEESTPAAAPAAPPPAPPSSSQAPPSSSQAPSPAAAPTATKAQVDCGFTISPGVTAHTCGECVDECLKNGDSTMCNVEDCGGIAGDCIFDSNAFSCSPKPVDCGFPDSPDVTAHTCGECVDECLKNGDAVMCRIEDCAGDCIYDLNAFSCSPKPVVSCGPVGSGVTAINCGACNDACRGENGEEELCGDMTYEEMCSDDCEYSTEDYSCS